ncbi:early transcription factor [Carp edema virus]|nr:early transcription factor [Carp edema virus]
MNKIIFDKLTKTSKDLKSLELTILPHQMATLDFIFKTVLVKNQGILLFHEMGSGKTLLALLFALLVSVKKTVIILLPNTNILNIWKQNLDFAEILICSEIKKDNIQLYTISHFIGMNSNDKNFNKEKIQIYKDCVFIVDEAHNLFGNKTGVYLMTIKKTLNVPFLLLTGSPINNTPKTLVYIISLITGEDVSNSVMINQKTKIIHINLSEEGEQQLRKSLENKISYYKNELTTVPTPKFDGEKILEIPAILCPMSDIQEKEYIIARQNTNNEMFERLVINVSLAALGKQFLYNEVASLNNLEDQELMANLRIHKGSLIGKELVTLDISSKMKYFINYIKEHIDTGLHKHLIYFSNATYGSFIIKAIMLSNGISEYNGSLAKDPICMICNTKKTCKQCIWLTFAILTSKVSEVITPTLEIFNSTKNKKGYFLTFLFASNVLSESYTLKEVKTLWFLTIPETYSQFIQIIGRAIRKFSYENHKEDVRIKILSTVPKSYKHKVLHKNMKDDEIDQLPFDIKKQYYLELKSNESDRIYDIFKELSEKYSSEINEHVKVPMMAELTRQFFNKHCRVPFNSKDLRAFLKVDGFKTISPDFIESTLTTFVDSHMQVINDTFKSCLLYRHKDEIITVPIRIELPNYYINIKMNKVIKGNEELEGIKELNDVILTIHQTEKIISYNDKIININSAIKEELIEICKKLGIENTQGKRMVLTERILNKLKELQKLNPNKLYIINKA